jgi:bifunctional DNA-binding transcriptional regulator/antitoxin component of YhaV-PrlF toxin-antitoxin module
VRAREEHKNTEKTGSDTKEITKIFLSGRLSATLIIPIEMARRHGLESPSHVVVEERQDGIFIKKLEL